MRVLLMLALLLTTGCAAKTGIATIVYRDGGTLSAHGIYKPTVEECAVIFESDTKITITPLDVVWGAYWEEWEK